MDDPQSLQKPAASVSTPRPAQAGPTLIRNVDLCRGLFAFLVVAAHSYDVCWVIHPEAMKQLPEAVRTFLFATVQAGFYWVMGFFVISGYCIQLSASRMIDSGKFPLGLYLKARFTRIMPLYYLGLLFALLVEYLVSPIRPPYYPDGLDRVGFASQLIFIQRLTRTFGAFAPSWTITNELFYYVFFGMLAVLAARSKIRPASMGLGCCAAGVSILVAMHLSGFRQGWILSFGLLFGLGINWFLGALVAIHGPRLMRQPKLRSLARVWPIGIATAVGLRAWDQVPELVIDLLLGVTCSLLLIRFIASDQADQAQSSTRSEPKWLGAIAEFVGLASYPTYLFHGPILLTWAAVIRQSAVVTDWRLTWCILVVSGISVGCALGWFLERPIMVWRAGLLKRWKREATLPARSVEGNHPSFAPSAMTQGV